MASLKGWITSRTTTKHQRALEPTTDQFTHLIARGFIDNPNRDYLWENWDDNFNLPVKNGSDRTVAQVGFDWLRSLPDHGKRIIWFKGETGMGKTHLACSLAVFYSVVEEKTLAYCNLADKLGKIRDGFGNNANAEHFGIEQSAGILVIDDIGTERNTLWVLEMMYRLIESRRGRPTIITSNFTVAEYCRRLYKSSRKDDDPIAIKMAATKIDDRLKQGKGGLLVAEVMFSSKIGSYRRIA